MNSPQKREILQSYLQRRLPPSIAADWVQSWTLTVRVGSAAGTGPYSSEPIPYCDWDSAAQAAMSSASAIPKKVLIEVHPFPSLDEPYERASSVLVPFGGLGRDLRMP